MLRLLAQEFSLGIPTTSYQRNVMAMYGQVCPHWSMYPSADLVVAKSG